MQENLWGVDMSSYDLVNKDLMVSQGLIGGSQPIHKFGHNKAVGTTYVPVTSGGVWETPQVSGATTLRVKAGGDAADTALGLGAQAVMIEGISPTGALITDTLATAGVSASAVTANTYIRILRVTVTGSGVYADQSTPSHVGDIVIEASGGGDWATIIQNGYGHSQSQIGVYTVPLGFDAYLESAQVTVESNKLVDTLILQRQNILQTSAPYSASRVVQEFIGLEGGVYETVFGVPIKFPELTDFGYMARVDSQTAKVSVDMEITLIAR